MEKVRDELEDIGATKVMLQVPDGLRRKAHLISDHIPAEVTLWGGTCYGACDLPLSIGDNHALIHMGHTCLPDLKHDYHIVYVEGRSHTPFRVPEKIYHKMEGKIALYSTVQHLDHMKEFKTILDEKGYSTCVGEGDPRIKYPGQLLGCNFTARVKDADTHVYIGTGIFHPLGLSLSMDKDVITLDPVTGELDSTWEKRDRMLRIRFAAIQKIKEAKRIGVIVSVKPGQRRMEEADAICSSCNSCKKVEFDEVEPELVDSFGWDGMVNTACPRLALDDHIRFKTTVVTPTEFMIAKEELDWRGWKVDEIKGRI